MTRRALLLLSIFAACGGTPIPQHNGYKSETAKPWKKFKTLKFDDKGEAKAEGDLSYPDRRRSAWFAVEMPVAGELDLRVEITPPGDSTNDAFDLGLEVLDAGNRMLVRKDGDEGDQQQELNKTAALKDLSPGHYLVHLYLESRLDTAEYILHAGFKASAPAEAKSDFPAQVAFLGPLAQVPLTDDAPRGYRPTTPTAVTRPRGKAPPPPPPPPPADTTISARIISVSIVGGGTQITVGRGTSSGASNGMKGKIAGVANGSFTLASCNERACTATLQGVTPDQIKGSGQVVLSP